MCETSCVVVEWLSSFSEDVFLLGVYFKYFKHDFFEYFWHWDEEQNS